MKSIGGAMFFFGVGSIVLNLLDREFVILAWIDLWGESAAWAIRGALIVVGAILWIVGNSQEGSPAQEGNPDGGGDPPQE